MAELDKVVSQRLPLSLDDEISEQPKANSLYFRLNRKLGVRPPHKVYPHALPLPLSRLITEQPPSNRLPFTLSRPLRRLEGSLPNLPTPKPPTPPKPKRKMTLVANMADIRHQSVLDVANCLTYYQSSQNMGGLLPVVLGSLMSTHQCAMPSIAPFIPLVSFQDNPVGIALTLATYQYVEPNNMVHLPSCQHLFVTKRIAYQQQTTVFGGVVCHFMACTKPTVQAVIAYHGCQAQKQRGTLQHNQQTYQISASIPVPCRYYPLPEPPPTPEAQTCRVRPPSDKLPFILTRKSHTQQRLPASALPFALTCWHDVPAATTANLRSYLVHNTISATIGGIQIDPLSFSIKTDMDSLYWQGQLDITTKDFTKIKEKLDVARGNEPIINVVINDTNFIILAEDVSKTRQFANHTYSLSGRSATAKLSAEYASGVVETVEQSLYASQIVNHALADLPFVCESGVSDWLIPSGTYATSDKTPIAIIDDIAKACGGFVLSDKTDSKLFIKPRYKKAAWELASATPDVIVPLDVVRQISQQKQSNPRYNTIVLTSSNQGAIVYREREGRDKEAPSQNNALYTAQECIIPAGITQLSNSGIHEQVSIVMRWADKYNLKLANLGDIWQINDKAADGTDDAWRAIVQSVALDVKVDDGVPVIWQTVGLDRYLDT